MNTDLNYIKNIEGEIGREHSSLRPWCTPKTYTSTQDPLYRGKRTVQDYAKWALIGGPVSGRMPIRCAVDGLVGLGAELP